MGAVDAGLAGTAVEISSAHWGRRRIRTPLVGAHQARNAAFAAELLALLPDDVRPSWSALEAGFAAVRWPGRMQVERVRGTTYLLDVAHNPDGARALAAALDTLDLPQPIVLVAGILADKEWREMLEPLTARASATVLTTAPSAPALRVWDPEEAARYAGEELRLAARVIPDLASALQRASTLAPHGTVVVTGSVHTVGDSLVFLGLSPP
jgi:dihydrofolate synthase / folylpolyglutamate synthase